MEDPQRSLRLLDIVVSILLVSVLFALLASIVSAAREAGRRAQCQDNLRQIGLGLICIQTQKNAFPNSGTFDDDPAVHGGDPRASAIYRAIMALSTFQGDPSPLLHSWVIDFSPYIDNAGFYNAWNRDKSYVDTTVDVGFDHSNSWLSDVGLGILKCPDDDTAIPGMGNISYVVNGGFSRWYAIPVGWEGSKVDGMSANGSVLRWAPEEAPWQASLQLGRKLGVMFPGTKQGDQPWDVKTTPRDLVDGAALTLLVGENTLVGASRGTKYSGGLPTNWACPLPNYTTFLGSDDVCRTASSATDCLAGQLAPTSGGKLSAGWKRANDRKAVERFNGGSTLTVEGSFPFIKSGHPGGANFVFCDGSVRFISETIDGGVYAELITPAGSLLPPKLRQPSRVFSPVEE